MKIIRSIGTTSFRGSTGTLRGSELRWGRNDHDHDGYKSVKWSHSMGERLIESNCFGEGYQQGSNRVDPPMAHPALNTAGGHTERHAGEVDKMG